MRKKICKTEKYIFRPKYISCPAASSSAF